MKLILALIITFFSLLACAEGGLTPVPFPTKPPPITYPIPPSVSPQPQPMPIGTQGLSPAQVDVIVKAQPSSYIRYVLMNRCNVENTCGVLMGNIVPQTNP